MSRKQTDEVRNAIYKKFDNDAMRRFGHLIYGKGVTHVRTDKNNVTTVVVDTVADDYKEGFWEAVSDALEQCKQYSIESQTKWSLNSIRLNVTFTLKHKPMQPVNLDEANMKGLALWIEMSELSEFAFRFGARAATIGVPLLTQPEFLDDILVKGMKLPEKRGYMPLAIDALYAMYRAGREAAWRVYDGEDKEYLEVLI